MRLFKPLPYYQSLWSRREQDLEFWKEVATALVDEKHNTKTLRNRYPITMFQKGPLHKPYFIAINNWGQVIIGPNKKNSGYICGRGTWGVDLIHEDMNAEKGILLQSMPQEYSMNLGQGLWWHN